MFIKIERLPGNPTSWILSFLGHFLRTSSVHSPRVMRTLQLPCHCTFWDDGMPQYHVEILHYQSFWKWLALCLPIQYPEHCQEYPPLQDTLFLNTIYIYIYIYIYTHYIHIYILYILYIYIYIYIYVWLIYMIKQCLRFFQQVVWNGQILKSLIWINN